MKEAVLVILTISVVVECIRMSILNLKSADIPNPVLARGVKIDFFLLAFVLEYTQHRRICNLVRQSNYVLCNYPYGSSRKTDIHSPPPMHQPRSVPSTHAEIASRSATLYMAKSPAMTDIVLSVTTNPRLRPWPHPPSVATEARPKALW